MDDVHTCPRHLDNTQWNSQSESDDMNMVPLPFKIPLYILVTFDHEPYQSTSLIRTLCI